MHGKPNAADLYSRVPPQPVPFRRALGIFLRLLSVMLFLCVASPAQTSDTDGDGQTDSQELLAGTDPYDDQSVEWTGLAAWRFDDGSFVGNAGQEPISTENVVITAGFEDFAASFAATDPIVKLQYRGIEEDGSAVDLQLPP